MAKFTNRLSQESSPYLLQHAHNPVNWFPWCEEALERSRTENKMIFLSIGYSSCHWCHVMERESFEDESVARFLNDNFVCIKVDREERPDIDAIYMDAVQLISRHGGWPLNVWLTPTLAPLYGGTYFPPEPSHQRPSFMMVLQRLLQVWREEPEKVFKQTQEITEALSTDLFERNHASFSAIDYQKLADFLRRAYEPQFGGFSAAPKFPMPMTIRLAFILGRNQEFSYLNNRALRTLDAMRLGGIWDHVGGGFSRYSVDDSWTVPHFEKMLYDNAQLLHCYLDAWQVSGKTHYLDVAKGIIEFLEREMKDPCGLFYCALDADSEGEEGKFYVWSELELKQILSEEEFNLVSEYWEISEEGNFEGNIIPRFQRRKFASLSDISDEIFKKLNPIHTKLLLEREKRIRPGLDSKMLCSWNAMLLISLSRMGQLLGGDWIYKAKELGDSMIAEFWKESQLFRIKTNDKISQKAFLDDYALFIVGLTNLWQITQDDTFLEFAEELKSQMIERFYNSEKQRFFFSGTHHEEIIARKVDIFDNAVPGGLGSALSALISLNKINPDSKIQQIISQQISLAGEMAVLYPLSCSFLLQAMVDWYEESKEIVVFGEKSEEFRAIWRKHFDSFNVAIFRRQNESSHELVQGKVAENGETLAWICHHFSCDAPISNLTEFSYTIGT